MSENKVKQIHSFGQSIWLDFIDREIMSSGKLKKLIDDDGVRGVTSNPAIFEKAITSSSDYDADIATLAKTTSDNEELFFCLGNFLFFKNKKKKKPPKKPLSYGKQLTART